MKHFFLLALTQAMLLLGGHSAAGQTLTRVANLAITSTPNGLAGSGSTVYLAGASFNLDTYSFSQPTAPVRLSSIPTGTSYPRVVVAGGTKAYVLGYGLGPVVSSSMLRVFEMSQPGAPVAGAAVTLGAPDQYIAANGSVVCIANSSDALLRVYDASLNLLATVNTATSTGQPSRQVVLNGTVVYIQKISSFDVYNLAVPSAPVYVATVSGYLSNVSGSLGFGLETSNGSPTLTSNKLYVYDVSNPLQPVLKGNATNNGGTLLAASGNRVYTTGRYITSNSSSQLQAFDVSNPAAPVLLATAAAGSTAVGLAANGNYVYLADNSTLQAYSLTGVLAAPAPALPAVGLYPSPAHGTLTLAQVPARTPVAIYDATGRLRLQTTAPESRVLDINTLSAGLYVARIGGASYRLLVE